MRKLVIILSIISITFANSILPTSFGNCTQISFFNKFNTPLPINDYLLSIKKYSCVNNIIYIGMEDRIPGILKLNINNNSAHFLLKHLKIQNLPAAVYIDKNLHKGVIAIKLNNKKTLKIIFNGTDYKKILKEIKPLNIKEIKKAL
jgi:hypothetical protein